MKKILLTLLAFNTTFLAMQPNEAPQKKSILTRAKDRVFKKSKLNADFRIAVLKGNVAEVERFLKLGIGPNTLCKKQFPLLLAAGNGHIDVCRILLDAGADVNAASKKSDAALLGAADNGDSEICKLLIERGADIHARCAAGECTPLLYAAQTGLSDICQILIDKGADVNATNNHRANALMKTVVCAQEGPGDETNGSYTQEERVIRAQLVSKVLIDAGINVNASDEGMYDALKYALQFNACDALSHQLLSAGANVMRSMRLYEFFTIYQRFISNIVLSPDLSDLTQCKERTVLILWCLKQINPRAPKQINWMVLAHIPTHHLGKILINRKLRGLSIPLLLTNCAAQTLYASTITQLKLKGFSALKRYHSEKWDFIEKSEETFETRFGPEIWKTICTRLEQPKLLCNNPSQ